MKEKDLEKKAKEMAEKIKGHLGTEALGKDLKEIKDQIEKLSSAQKEQMQKTVQKVFVSDDVQKEVSGLTKEEKMDAYAYALMSGDETSIKALSEGVNADGGYTVPQDFYKRLLQEIADKAIMRKEVTVVPMKTNVLTLTLAQNGPEVYWTTEGETKTTTSLEFSQPTITAYKLAAIIYLTDELMDDSAFDLANVIIGRFADRLAEEEDRVIINGSGVGRPTGLFIAGTIGTRACAGNLDFDDIINLIYDLPIKYRSKGKFLVNTANIRELRLIQDANNRYMWQEPVAAGQPATIHGYKVIEHSWVPEDQILFGDIKTTYWVGERQRMTVKVTNDTETTFTQDKTAIRIVRRFGGTVVIPNASRILNTIP